MVEYWETHELTQQVYANTTPKAINPKQCNQMCMQTNINTTSGLDGGWAEHEQTDPLFCLLCRHRPHGHVVHHVPFHVPGRKSMASSCSIGSSLRARCVLKNKGNLSTSNEKLFRRGSMTMCRSCVASTETTPARAHCRDFCTS